MRYSKIPFPPFIIQNHFPVRIVLNDFVQVDDVPVKVIGYDFVCWHTERYGSPTSKQINQGSYFLRKIGRIPFEFFFFPPNPRKSNR